MKAQQGTAFDAYLDQVAAAVEAARTQRGTIRTAAGWMADAIADDRVVTVFGASHAGLLAQDLMYRAGGLAPIDAVLPRQLMLDTRPITDTTKWERRPGFGSELFANRDLGPGDVVILISVSGRNPVVVEAANTCNAAGARVVAVTSLQYSRSVAGRSGPRLFEVADLVIDLPVRAGDAAVQLTAGCWAGPTSSAVGAAVLHGLCVTAAAELVRRGIEPPVFRSANTDDGDAANQHLLARYRDRVGYLERFDPGESDLGQPLDGGEGDG